MGKFTKKLCSIVLVVCLVFSAMAGFQHETVTVSAADETFQTLVGNGDTNGPEAKSNEYSMKEKNSTVTFYVKALTDAHLFIELRYEGDYITTTTMPGAWTWPIETAENGPTQLTIEKTDEGFNDFQQGKEYTIIVTRKDYEEAGTDKTDYEFVIKYKETGNTCVTFYAKNSVLTEDVSLYLVAIGGSVEMRSDSVPKPQPQSHGTDRTKRYSLSDVNNTPPADYVIPKGLVRDAKDKAYEKYFPKDSIQTVKVEMDESNLNYLLQHAEDKPYVMTNRVTIGDTTLGYAGLKTKGNYTLYKTNESDSDRFSFTLNFGKYIKKKQYGVKQNFYGCQKISFNNCLFDKTIMKEYNAMRLMDEMGIPTPQYSLAKLYINNQYYGVYFMVEAMDSAIIERYKNVSSKEVSDYLVKPSYTHMQYHFEGELEQCLKGSTDYEFTMEALNQAGLLWKDENGNYHVEGILWEYNGIWENDDDTLQDVANMIPKVLTWNRKVQLLSDGRDFDGNGIDVNSTKYLNLLESVMDTDEAVRYFATHSFLVQMDNMFTWGQNYGVYVDEQGKSLFVPWDYDLSWGTAAWDAYITAEQSVNWDIDKMYPGNFEDYGAISEEAVYSRAPLFHVIWQNKSLLQKYHTYIEDCAKLVSLGGTTSAGKKVEPARFAKTIKGYYSQVTEAAKIENLAKNVYYVGEIKQPEGAEEGIPALKKLIARRAVSVWLQAHGKKADVTGYGCDILKIGTNFVYDEKSIHPSVKGTLTVVDEDTGIFATTTYPNGNKEAGIQAKQLTSGQEEYAKISQQIDDPLVYKIELANADTLTSNYKLYIPVPPDRENVKIYAYSADTGKLQGLKAKIEDNIYCVTGTGFTYIVIGESDGTEEDTVKVGKTVVAGQLKYKITKAAGKGEVSLTGTSRKKSDKKFTSLKIGDEVKIKGRSYKITSIGKNAFSGCKYLKSVTIGKNVDRINEKAFYKCSNLRKITVKTVKFTANKVGKQAFKGILAKAIIKVP